MVNDVVRIFVSSPSDLGFERSRAERVAERLSGLFDGLKIVPYRWEAGQYFSAHTNFQDAIPEVEAFDIVIGLFWSRLGTPLPPSFAAMPDGRPYPSGTAFEILRAIEHRRRAGQGKPDVFVYRKMAGPPAAPPDDMVEQQARLERLGALNAFIAEWFVNETDGFKAAFTPFDTTDDFEVMLEAHLRTWLHENRRLGRERAWRVEERGAPFRGLDPFEAQHRDVFFGRRADVERARERLADAVARGCGFLLVEGASGAGKSSLVRAGLIPRLIDLHPDLRVARLRPSADPLLALAEALAAPGALPELGLGDFPTSAHLARHLAGGGDPGPVMRALSRAQAALQASRGADALPEMPLVILVDQAEELFADAVAPARRSRLTAVLADLAATGQVWIVATLRADARAAALGDPALAGLIDGGAQLSLMPPGPEALADIVRAPAAAAGLAFDRQDGQGLDEVLIAEARDTSALPLVQFLLAQLYDRAVARVRDRGATLGDVGADEPVAVLSFDDYRALGGIQGALRRQAEAAFESVAPGARATLPRLVRALTDLGPGGTVLREAPLAEVAPDPDQAALVAALVAARILARDGARVRFCHGRVLVAWDRAADAVRDGATFLRVRAEVGRAAARWRSAGGASLLLPRGVPLAEAEAMLAAHPDEIPAETQAYIRASRARARRGQTLTAAAALVCATLAGVATWQHQVAVDQAAAAQAAQSLAEAAQAQAHGALRQATAAADALVFDLAQKLRDHGAPGALTRAVLDQARALQDGLAGHFPDDPALMRSRSAALNETGLVLGLQGETAAARAAHDQALALARALVLADGNAPGRHRDVAVALTQLGDLLARTGERGAARAALDEAATILRRLAASAPHDDGFARDADAAQDRLGALLLDSGDLVGAGRVFAQTLAEARARLAAGPDAPDRVRAVWVGLGRVGDHAMARGDLAAAQAARVEALGLARDLAARDPDRTDWRRDLGLSLGRIAEIALARDDAPAAAAALAEMLDHQRALRAIDPTNTLWSRDLAVGLGKAAEAALLRGEPETASTWADEALRLTRSLPEDTAARRDLIAALTRAIDVAAALGQPTGALFDEATALAQVAAEDDPSAGRELGILLVRRGDAARADGDLAAADAAYVRALAQARAHAARAGDAASAQDLARVLDRLGDVRRRTGALPDARAAYVESIGLTRASARVWSERLALAVGLIKLAEISAGPARSEALRESLHLLETLAAEGALPPAQADWPARLRVALAQPQP